MFQQSRGFLELRRASEGGTGPAAQTLLERHLSGGGDAAITPLDAFKAARRKFLAMERIDMGELAAELGIGRATLYRWVGSRDRLLGEILWSLAEVGLKSCRDKAKGKGADWVMDVYNGFGDLILETPSVLHFVKNEPETALRVMTTKHS